MNEKTPKSDQPEAMKLEEWKELFLSGYLSWESGTDDLVRKHQRSYGSVNIRAWRIGELIESTWERSQAASADQVKAKIKILEKTSKVERWHLNRYQVLLVRAIKRCVSYWCDRCPKNTTRTCNKQSEIDCVNLMIKQLSDDPKYNSDGSTK